METECFIGTDIVSVPRIKASLERHPAGFRRHSFTKCEQEYCDSRSQPEQHYAGRFAAKEAIKKAILSHDRNLVLPINQIEITNRKDGCPQVRFINDPLIELNCKVSISHTEEFATATALISL